MTAASRLGMLTMRIGQDEPVPRGRSKMAGENWISTVEEFFQKCFRGEIEQAVALLDPEVTYDVSGSHPRAGRFRGPAEVAKHMSDLLEVTHGTLNVLRWEDWMVGVNHLAVLLDLRLQRTGTVHTTRVIVLVGMSNEDRIRSVEVFFADPVAADRVFS